MDKRTWYKEKFFTEQEPDDYILVEFHAPVETEPGCLGLRSQNIKRGNRRL